MVLGWNELLMDGAGANLGEAKLAMATQCPSKNFLCDVTAFSEII